MSLVQKAMWGVDLMRNHTNPRLHSFLAPLVPTVEGKLRRACETLLSMPSDI